VKQVLKVDYRKTTHEINTGKKELWEHTIKQFIGK
jgi:hypothetical protein